MKITREPFGEIEGAPVERFTLENDNGVEVKTITYGGTVTSILVPDKEGNVSDIVCGFDTLEGYFSDEYKTNSPYFGCLVGRYAARIKDGRFNVDGNEYQVATNDGPNHLHGGIKGFDKRVWDVVGTSEDSGVVSLTLALNSEDGEESFSGYYAFTKPVGKLDKVAEVVEPTTGRKLEVLSTELGTLFYTGRYTSDNLKRESGAQFGQFRAFCIETSKYPNGPNIDGSPKSVLRPSETYDETTVYKLSWA